MLLTKEESSFVVVPDGMYTAEMTDYKEGTAKFGPNLKLFFTIDASDPEYAGAVVTMLCPPKLAAGNKLDLALTALGLVADVGQDVDLDSVLGAQCQVLVTTTEKDGKTYSNVIKITPARAAAPRAAAPVRAAAPAPRPAAPVQRPVAAAPAARPVPPRQAAPPRQAPVAAAPAEDEGGWN